MPVCHISWILLIIIIRIVCKTGPMASQKEGAVIATIGEAVIIWETPFRYQVYFQYFLTILIAN